MQVRHTRDTCLGNAALAADGQNVLPQDGMQSVLQVMQEYREVMQQHGVRCCKAVATAAVREAANAETFLSLATAALGHQVQVITGVHAVNLLLLMLIHGLSVLFAAAIRMYCTPALQAVA